MFEATEAERKIREINLLMDMQINILFCRTSEHYFSLYLKRLSWDLLKTKNVSSTHAQNLEGKQSWQSLELYFEGAKKQACNYAENKQCYRCFSGNLARIYRAAFLMNFFQCIRSKSQWSAHLVVLFNHLILLVTKYILKKPGSLSSRFA